MDDFYIEGFTAKTGETLILQGKFTSPSNITLDFEETYLKWTGISVK